MRHAPDKSYWSATFKVGTRRVYAWERRDRNSAIFLKFTDPSKSGADRRVKLRLPGEYPLRDRTGKVLQKHIARIERAIENFVTPFLSGRRPVAEANARPLSLSEGFKLALAIGDGKFATQTRRWDEVSRASRKLEKLLGAHTPLIEISPKDVRGVWRRLASAYKEGRKDSVRCGARQTEVTVDALYSVASWLRDEDLVPAHTLLPRKKWRKKLKADWEEIVGIVIAPARPRHSASEMRRLFDHIHDPQVDPRLGLALALGAELRLGQVLRCKRSDLTLPLLGTDNFATSERVDYGMLRVGGAGRKDGGLVAFTPSDRRTVEHALSTYLLDYEVAYREGQISDYPLFPAGRLKRGKVVLVHEPTALGRDGALKMFRRLEAVAGVPSVPKRGWYGLRRIAADLAEDIQHDERVLNSITGHRDSATRQNVYQDKLRPAILRKAAQTREAVRLGSTLDPNNHAKSVA